MEEAKDSYLIDISQSDPFSLTIVNLIEFFQQTVNVKFRDIKYISQWPKKGKSL